MFTGPQIVTDGLVLALDAANTKSYPGTGTTWTDLSGNGNNGTLTNGPTFNSSNVGNIVFDGTNDSVAISNLGLSTNTIEGWINSADVTQGTTGGNGIVSAIGYYSRVATDKYTYIGFLGNSTLTFRIDNGSTSHKLVADYTYSADVWYHVALSYNASNGSTVAYLNGSSIGSTTASTGITFNSVPFDIAKAENSQFFDGSVALVKVHNRVLTASEVLQNYNATKSRFGL